MCFYKFIANGFAAFLDFGIGTLIVSLISVLLNHEIQWWQCFVGGIFALVPDFDVIWMFLARGRVYGDHHQFITHRPIFGIGIATLAGYFIGGSFWMLTALICVVWHYIHDTEEFANGGIAWLWPISSQYVYFSGFKHPSESMRAKFIGKHDEWLNLVWLQPSRTSVIETSIGSLALGSAMTIVAMSWLGLILALFPMIVLTTIWVIYGHKKPTR